MYTSATLYGSVFEDTVGGTVPYASLEFSLSTKKAKIYFLFTSCH
jgi:hypothetical protein